MQLATIVEQLKKKEEKKLPQLAEVRMPDSTLAASLRDIAFQDSCSLCPLHGLKGRKWPFTITRRQLIGNVIL